MKEENMSALLAAVSSGTNKSNSTTSSPLSTQQPALLHGTITSGGFYRLGLDGKYYAVDVTQLNPPMKTEPDEIKRPAHYNQGKIETWDYILSQGLGYLEGNIVKYVTRYKLKGGHKDLLKAQAYLAKLLEETK